MTQPHVFVVMADILNLRCDAWLLPTDSMTTIERHWLRAHPDLRTTAAASASSEFRSGSALAEAVHPWDPAAPLPIMTAVPDDGTWGPAVVGERLEAFVRSAVSTIPNPDDRPYRLLALPFFGTAGGGAGNHLGAALCAILDAATELAARYGVDLVLVLRDKAAFSLAQKLRRQKGERSSWPSLGASLQEKAKSLGKIARAGHLVPFLGAGISVSAGAPSWGQLLDTLRRGVRLATEGAAAFDRLDLLDQAGVLEQLYTDQYGSRAAFGEAVAAAVDLPRYGLAPALLAALPSSGAITLNYDRLFEMACGDAQRPRTVMPENIPAVGNDWLLKLHGSVSAPESIVLTRDDYLGYNSNREALSALVKAHLLTHHLLFVGFGLADDHFHEIVHDVRRALPATGSKEHQLGTVLSLFHEPLQNLVWSGRLDILPMSGAPAENAGKEEVQAALAAAGRELEIFLDMLASYATDNHSYLLAPAYDAGLNEAESRLRAQLMELAAHRVLQKRRKSGHCWTRHSSDWAAAIPIMDGQTMKVEKRVLEQVAEYLGNYVYLLIDPRTGIPFYLGRGTRTRVLDHGLEADALTAPAEEPQGEHSRKIAAIYGIRQDGLEPEIWILRHGMGPEYTQVEAAAIDLLSSFLVTPSQALHPLAHLDQLTNARRESSHGHGIETLGNIVSEFAAPNLGVDTPPLLLVTLKSWVASEEVAPGGSVRAGYGFKSEWLSARDRAQFAAELGDSVRCWWKLSKSRIERDGIEHVVAVHRGVTRGLFKIRPDAWEQDPITGRRGFQVSPVFEGPVFDKVIGQYGYRTPDKKRGAVTPLTYWPRG